MNARKNKVFSLAALTLVGGLTLAACGGGDTDDAADTGNGGGDASSDAGGSEASEGSGDAAAEQPSGTLAGAGSSAQGAAEDAWIAGYQGVNPNAQVSYDKVGSGTGREQFVAGAVAFAGTDAALNEEELADLSSGTCQGGAAFDVPDYISPIAIVFNLEGVDSLNLSPQVLAGIFMGEITTWNDEKIAADNPDVELPDTPIVPVNRSDDSGTTENFTEYLDATAGDVWTHGVVETWPIEGTQSGKGTSGLIATVQGGNGTIGYADASQAGELGTAAIKVGEEWVEYTPEAAAKAVEVSPRAEGREDNDIVMELDRTTTEAGAYPLVLVSYLALCDTYEDQATADLVKSYASYVVSPEGQQLAAEQSGSAPLTDKLSSDAQASIDGIKAAG